MIYYVGCGVGRLARDIVSHDTLADATGQVNYDEGIPIPSNLDIALVLRRTDEALTRPLLQARGHVAAVTVCTALRRPAGISAIDRIWDWYCHCLQPEWHELGLTWNGDTTVFFIGPGRGGMKATGNVWDQHDEGLIHVPRVRDHRS